MDALGEDPECLAASSRKCLRNKKKRDASYASLMTSEYLVKFTFQIPRPRPAKLRAI